jgi:hypothetical protein
VNKTIKLIYPISFISLIILKFYINLRVDVGISAYDTMSYFEFSLINSVRMPQISYIFSTIQYFGAISIFQSTISIICWSFFTLALNSFFNNYYVKILNLLLVFSLATSSPIMKFDLIILSESLAISFGVLLMATFIYYVKERNSLSYFYLAIAIILFGFPKQSNAFISLLLAIIFFGFTISKFKKSKNVYPILFSAISFVATLFFYEVSKSNNFIEQQVALVNIIERTYDDFDKQQYWLNQGFPAIAYQVYGSAPFKTPGEMTADTPQVKAWKQTEYSHPAEKFILANPIFATFAPVVPQIFINHYSFYESIFPPLATGVIESDKTIDLNSKTMNVIPNYLSKLELPRTFWWPQSEVSIEVLLILIFGTIFISLIILIREKDHDNLKIILVFSYLFFILGTWANWNVALVYTLDRLLTPWAVQLRLTFIIAIIYLINLIMSKQEFSKSQD